MPKMKSHNVAREALQAHRERQAPTYAKRNKRHILTKKTKQAEAPAA